MFHPAHSIVSKPEDRQGNGVAKRKFEIGCAPSILDCALDLGPTSSTRNRVHEPDVRGRSVEQTAKKLFKSWNCTILPIWQLPLKQ